MKVAYSLVVFLLIEVTAGASNSHTVQSVIREELLKRCIENAGPQAAAGFKKAEKDLENCVSTTPHTSASTSEGFCSDIVRNCEQQFVNTLIPCLQPNQPADMIASNYGV